MGRPVSCFAVQTTQTWAGADGASHERAEWFNVVAWGALAELCKGQLGQGQAVYVEGRLQTRSWEDPSGSPCSRSELVASQVIALGARPEAASA